MQDIVRMQDILRANARAMQLWMDLLVAQQQAAVTIALRLPLIAAETGKPLTATSETVRMVTEKTKAATLGGLAAIKAGARRRRGATSAVESGLAVLDAFTKPGRTAVRSNSRRLSRRKPKR